MEVDRELAETARRIRSTLPCSIELPAGAGKTELIAALAAECARSGERALLLTHTNAGVDALRERVRDLGVRGQAVRIRTIDSWCFNLVRHFPQLAGIEAREEPDWDRSSEYERGAERAIQARAVRRMIRASYEVIAVDEYQDCGADQHAVVLALDAVVPTAIFGDPLQALFDFADSPMPTWEEVLAQFPPIEVPVRPWRWEKTNRELGRWLFDIRELLSAGRPITLEGAPVSWIDADGGAQTKTDACFAQPANEDSVVALGILRTDCAHVAKGLNGRYSVMEELEGKVLLKFADLVDGRDSPAIAQATVQFAINCATGVADAIAADKRRRLGEGKTVGTRDANLADLYAAVNALLSDASPSRVREALTALARAPRFVPYCREAWYGILNALEHAAHDADLTVRNAVVRNRNRTRLLGRRPERRVVSRPRLAKGLEFDHAVLLDADRYTPTELYVALTRGRRSVTVLSKSQVLASASASTTMPSGRGADARS
jgi:superfamily I DNA/RNA helicase